jgi:lipopolysaccharide/colanic/teichoic acid biosynthesis glycosyltransferase
VKRCLDFVIGLCAVLILAPALLVIALVVRCTSPGPALFRQVRVGKDGNLFTIYKFRSMYLDADPRVHLDAVMRYFNGEQLTPGSTHAPYKLTSDARVTGVGAFLRKSSLDELPQLFNVVLGHMSLVGPRPALPYEVERDAAIENKRLSVPPGMTGLWQIRGRGRVSYGDALGLDLEYVYRRSFILDSTIIVLTIPALLSRRGSV